MGYWKNRPIEAGESGLVAGAADGKYVCADCFTDLSLKEVVRETVESDTCTFCGATDDNEIAAPLETVMEHISQCLLQLYEDPANGMSFESAEGGYQGETFDTWDLLDRIGMSDYLAEEAEGPLLAAIRECLVFATWCEKDPYALRQHEALSSSWEYFCEFIKHERRFFFLQEQPAYAERSFGQLLDPGAMLGALVKQALKLALITFLDQGARVFRVRQETDGKPHRASLDLGAPPSDQAVQANRMSPPGVVMTYVSEDEETALAETVDEDGSYSVGQFELARSAFVLDLTRLPEIPSIFDLHRASQRDFIIFLHSFAQDVSKPIDRDAKKGLFHVEYVPTQVVTEYFRVSPELQKAGVEGLRFASSRSENGASLVLFGGRDLLWLDDSEKQALTAQEERAAAKSSPLLRLVGSSSRTFPMPPSQESSSASPTPSSGRTGGSR